MNSYFWLLCGVWTGVIGAAFMRFRLKPAVASGVVSAREVAAFTRGFALWILLPCIFLWLLQRSVGTGATIECLNWPNPQRATAIALQVFLWVALLFWVFFRDGASTLSKFARASSAFGTLYRPPVFKALAVALVLAGVASLLTAGA